MAIGVQEATDVSAAAISPGAPQTGERVVQPRALAGLKSALVGVCFLMPLVVFPGLERPFSTPKLVFLTASVVLGTAIAGLAGRWKWPALPRGFSWSLAAWLAALGASALTGSFVSLVALWLPLAAVGWFLLLMLVRPEAKGLAIALTAAGTLVACVACLQFVGWDPFAVLGWHATPSGSARMRVFATLGNPNFVAAFLVGLMPLTASLRQISKRRGLFSMALAAQVLAVFATGSRGAILGLLAALIWLAVCGQLGRWRVFALAALSASLALLAWSPARELATTVNGRYYIWQAVAPHLAERPWLGFGPGAFEPQYAQWEAERWGRLGAPQEERKFAGFEDHAHNDYLETLVENGVTGLAGFLSIVICFLVFVLRQGRGQTGIVTASSAGVLALAAVALVDFPFRRPTELFLFWTLLAIAFLAASEPSLSSASERKDLRPGTFG
ncbi:MAG: O-antigen ligase family protein [Terriglobia bacterium]